MLALSLIAFAVMVGAWIVAPEGHKASAPAPKTHGIPNAAPARA